MKKKILFVNDEMTMGGVARILNTLLRNIDQDKYEVDLLILHRRGELLKEIPSYVNQIEGTPFFNTIDIPLKECKFNNIFSKLRLLFYMKTGLIKNRIIKERKKILCEKYDVEFCAKEGFCTIFTSFGKSKRKLNWVQTDYKIHNFSNNHMNLMKEALMNIDMNIACSNKVKESFSEIFNVSNIEVINNLIDNEKISKLSNVQTDYFISQEKINLITVSRFHKQKRLDRIINAYSKLKEFYSLTIIGGGELDIFLHEYAKKLGVEQNIKWIDITNNPYNMIRKSDLFVMSSEFEGYPTVTIESLLSSTPVLSTDVAGIKEQLVEPCHGFIVDNTDDSIYKKLNELKDKKYLLKQYKNKLLNYQYDNSSILNRYYQLF